MAIAIGDIHGCLAPLEKLVSRLPPGRELVFLGDYIDRGPDSAGVVAFLLTLAQTRPCRFLMGNHEDMLLKALRSPDHIGQWIINGGTATLKSYGSNVEDWRLQPSRGALFGEHGEFFKGLAMFYQDPHAIYVHAGINPALEDMPQQKANTLLWVREEFFSKPERWRGKPVVFGHTPTRFMGLSGREIYKNPPYFGIDTGCVYGGFLTAFDPATGEIWQANNMG
ncbi:MAG: serine/threonine protein phosphatase [Deltaproteobacteria bacterium]|nr:serine/threonine protein phosphatase [Deltaproteobacteria bacterium]